MGISNRRLVRSLVAACAAGLILPTHLTASSLHFSAPQQLGGGTEPSAAVTAEGTRFVTWQGGDPVSQSLDGNSWQISTGGHDSGKCVDPTTTHELFDAGDVDIAVDHDGSTVYVSSLSFNETEGIGVDIERGVRGTNGTYTWSIVNCHAGEVASDRPWIATGPNHGDLYLYEKDLHLETPVVRVSHDGGASFGPLSPVLTDPRYANYAAQVYNGNFAVAHDGTIYVPVLVPDAKDEASGATDSSSFPDTDVVVAVGHEDPSTHLITFVDHRIRPSLTDPPSTTNVAYIFGSVALDSADHPVVAWSQGDHTKGPYDVYMSSCAQSCADAATEINPLAQTWSAPVRVSSGAADPTSGGNHVFPLVAAGSPGHIALAWYGTTYAGDPTGGAAAGTLGSTPPAGQETWRTYVATATNWVAGSSATPSFAVADASGHTVHDGAICIGGTFCDLAGAPTCPPVGCGNRGLADNFGLTIDPHGGGALVTWTDQSPVDAHGNPETLIEASCQDGGPSLVSGLPDLAGCTAAGQPPPSVPVARYPALLVLSAAAALAVFGETLRRRRRGRSAAP